jgi:hypothetical protein
MKSKYKEDFSYILEAYKELNEDKKKFFVFEQWLALLDFFVLNEGLSKLREIKNPKQTLPRNVLDYYARKKSIKINSKNYRLNRFYKIVFILINFFFRTKFLCFDRANIYKSKFRDAFSFLYLKYFIANHSFKIDKKFQSTFFFKLKKKINSKLYFFLHKYISDIFFSIPSSNKDITLYVYPINFLFDQNFLKLLFYYQKPIIKGYQHGAGYGQFINSRLYDFEKKISDNFIDWYPINKSSYIGRFDKNKLEKKKKTKIFWVGSSLPIKPEIFLEKNYSKSLLISKRFIKKIDNNLCNLKNTYYVPHPRFRYLDIKTNLYQTKLKLEKTLKKNDIIIFDTISSTLMYFCIKNKIKFYIISEKKIESISGISKDYKNFLFKLKKKKTLIYPSQINILIKKLRQKKPQNIS